MQVTNPYTRRAGVALLLIILVALFTRLGDSGAATHFRYDEAQLSLLALKLSHGEEIPLLGIQSSAGVPNSPMSVYFLALPFLITSNPFFVTIFIAIWNVIGVGLLWLIAHRYLGSRVGFLAGMIYAVNPYAVGYSRLIWAQDFHTPIILIAIWLGLQGFLERKQWAQILCLPVLVIGIQIHFAAWTLLPIYGWFLLVGRKNLNWKSIALSIGLATLTMLPFMLGLAQNPESALERANLISSIIQDGFHFRWYPIEQNWNLITGLGIEANLRNGADLLLSQVPRLELLWQCIGISTLLGAILIFHPRWRLYSGLLWIWAGITLAAFIPIWTGSGVYHHYFVPSLPAFALLAACGIVGISELFRKRPGAMIGNLMMYGFIGAALLNQGMWSLVSYQFALDHFTYTESPGRTTTPFRYLMDVRAVLQEFDDIIILGGNPHETNYYIWEPLLYETTSCVRDLLINDGGIDVLPDGEFAVVVAPLFPINEGYIVPERYQNENPIEVPLRPGEDPYIIYPFTKAPEWTETAIVPVDTHAFENGIRLTGYYLGESFLQLQWQVASAPGSSYQYFAHFLDDDGERIGQRDAPFYVGQYWCAQDTLVTTVFVDLPPQFRTLRIGMYKFDTDGRTINQSILDEGQNPVGSWVDILLPEEENASS